MVTPLDCYTYGHLENYFYVFWHNHKQNDDLLLGFCKTNDRENNFCVFVNNGNQPSFQMDLN